MGFNKRYIDDDIVKDTYKKDGIKGLKALGHKIDAFIFSGECAELVVNALQGDIEWEELKNNSKIVR